MGRVFVITGSSRGIGLHLAKHLLLSGQKVVINGRNRQLLEQAYSQLISYGQVVAFAADVTDIMQVRNLWQFAVEKFGRVDVWINNAAVPQTFDFYLNLSLQEIRRVLAIDLEAPMLITRQVAALMQQQGGGLLLNVAGFGSDGHKKPRLVLYGTAKNALAYFTKALWLELKDSNVRLGLINPGMVRTEFLEDSLRGLPAELVERNRRFNQVFASDPEKIGQWLARKILQAAKGKGFVRLRYMDFFTVMWRLLKVWAARR